MGLHSTQRRNLFSAWTWLKPMEPGGKLPVSSDDKQDVHLPVTDMDGRTGASQCGNPTAPATVHKTERRQICSVAPVANLAAGSGTYPTYRANVATAVPSIAGQAVPAPSPREGYYASPNAIDRRTRAVGTSVHQSSWSPSYAGSPWAQYLSDSDIRASGSARAGGSYTRWGLRQYEFQQKIMAR
jgi:hypothetical protein